MNQFLNYLITLREISSLIIATLINGTLHLDGFLDTISFLLSMNQSKFQQNEVYLNTRNSPHPHITLQSEQEQANQQFLSPHPQIQDWAMRITNKEEF